MKSCELCEVPAKTFCESDQASLCWSCDAKVHGANFLVARHTRTLLCHACQSPTPWKASGERLGSTVSLCRRCAGGNKVDDGAGEESEGGNDDEVDTEDDDLDEEEDDDEEEDEEVGEDEDGDNQVVPWSSTTAPPPAPSSSSSDESVSRCNHGEEDLSESVKTVSFKRRRAEDHDFQDGSSGWLSKRTYGAEWRQKVGWLASGGESPPEVPLRPLSDGGTRVASAVDRYNEARG